MLIGVMSVGFVSCGDDDEPDNPGGNASIVGTWKGYSDVHKPSDDPMTAKFYEDGTCEIWWYHNPMLGSFYFTGTYKVSKKKMTLEGYYGGQGDRPSHSYSRTADFSIKGDQIDFYFDMTNWHLNRK